MRLATTKGTNALLERKGSRTAFLVTQGFADLLAIGTQQRPDLFTLNIEKPAPLYDTVVEIDERVTADGRIRKALDLGMMGSIVDELKRSGTESIAIALLHATQNPEHEIQLRDALKAAGFTHVSTSHELAGLIKILPRAETAVVNAYLAPLMETYASRVSSALSDGDLHLMTSAGGLEIHTKFRPKDSLLSGPAGGVVGAAVTGQELSERKLVAFDMGGTSTDVSRFDQHFDYQFEHRVGSARLMAPALRIETVAAGGGSICGYSPQGLFVGPESAGASPGPACYGAEGPLTLTDINLLLGRMDPTQFGIPIAVDASRDAFQATIEKIVAAGHPKPDEMELLDGFLNIANERMADTIREISLREGYAPSDYTLVAFGGAGGLHACQVAERLEINRILFPDNAGLLSAHGLRHARHEQFAQSQILQPLDEVTSDLPERISDLEAQAQAQLRALDLADQEFEITRRILKLRFIGQEASEEIEYESESSVRKAFLDRYRQVFGYAPEGKPIELVSIHVTAGSKTPALASQTRKLNRHKPEPLKTLPALIGNSEISVFSRDILVSGDAVTGPAIIQDPYATIYIAPHWEASVSETRTLILSRSQSEVDAGPIPQNQLVEEELFTHRFENLVNEMGSQLERTAVSTNVKDRLDFSCALLDADGELIANAPHIPVHLGALGKCTRTVAEYFDLKPEDVIVTNHPGFGGSHLPDVTLISPVFDSTHTLVGYVANRAHHAELGGIRPGSMPPNAKNLEEEGVVIPPSYLYRAGRAQWEQIRTTLTQAAYPTRALEDNLADLRAQSAANLKGVTTLQSLCQTYGSDTIRHQMAQLKQRAARATLTALEKKVTSDGQATEQLDDGTRIHVEIAKKANGLRIDFKGTAPQHPENFNANPGIVQSAVIYVIRLLVDQSLPLNEGLMEPIELRLPTCFLNPHFPSQAKECPAVVAGNVETSQRVVDALIRALDLAACSQGTMNNLIFGNESVSYYETIAGGAGAGPGYHGASAVHTHMTNTGITDPEILEQRYPVLLHQFSVRSGSGGEGEFRGGCGTIRELEFLEPVQVSLLTQHRNNPPYGAHGGGPGASGKQFIQRANGTVEALESTAYPHLATGDRLVIQTPGGGAWGSLVSR